MFYSPCRAHDECVDVQWFGNSIYAGGSIYRHLISHRYPQRTAHGGANEQVIGMLNEIGSVERVQDYIRKKFQNKERVMGFGHRVYKVKDPRASFLQALAKQSCESSGQYPLYEIAREIEKVMNEVVGHKGISANVDFYSGLIYHHMGIETDLFTPVFAMARVSGWLAHCFEQYKDNRLFRPDQIYEGERSRPYVGIHDRTTRAS